MHCLWALIYHHCSLREGVKRTVSFKHEYFHTAVIKTPTFLSTCFTSFHLMLLPARLHLSISFLHLSPPDDQEKASLISTWQIVLSVGRPIGANENMTFLRRGLSQRTPGTLIRTDKSSRKRILHAHTETYLQVHWSAMIKPWADKGEQWSGKRAPLGLFYSYSERRRERAG